jgi:hypothetical protein
MPPRDPLRTWGVLMELPQRVIGPADEYVHRAVLIADPPPGRLTVPGARTRAAGFHADQSPYWTGRPMFRGVLPVQRTHACMPRSLSGVTAAGQAA